jgi:uncharacterized protein involved in outer membrane biogenesis
MKPKRRRYLIVSGGALILIVVAAVVAVLRFNINSYKAQIETAASETIGLDVRINGKMRLSFFPFGFSARDIHFANEGGEILSLEHIKIGAELIPLLKKQLKITSCDLFRPTITIVKDSSGKYNFESIEEKLTKGRGGIAFSLNQLKLSKGTFVYLDKKTGEKTELKEINLAIKNPSIVDAHADIIENISFTGSIDCKEILQESFRAENLKAFVKAAKGIYRLQPFGIGSLVYLDKKTREKTELKEINLAIGDLSVAGAPGPVIKNLSFTGTMEGKELRRKDLKIDSIKSHIKAAKGVFYFNSLTMDIFGAKGEGDVTANESEPDAQYKIDLTVSKLDFEKLQESFGAKKLIGGKGDLVTSLTVKEKKGRSLLSGTNGTLSLRGNNLITHTVDLDKVLSAYEASQRFNLVDIGAFFIAGPLGSAALKGYRYGDVYYQARGGRGTITRFVSHWKIKNGQAEAADCAFATPHNRVALKGRLNLVSERYDNVTVALLDDKGCAKLKQSISGPFGAPNVGAVSAVQSLAEPIFNLYRKAKRFIQGGRCEVFYSGSVQQPR